MNIKEIEKIDFTDVPSSEPKLKIPLERVGISGRKHYVNVIDPFSNIPTRLLANLDIYANLNRNQRGLHMSRFEAQLHKIELLETMPIQEYCKTLVDMIKNSQGIKQCDVLMKMTYEKLVDKNISKRPSHELLTLICEASSNNDNYQIKNGIVIPIINACPCTQRWATKNFLKNLKKIGFDDDKCIRILQLSPLQSHTNRGFVSIIIQNDKIKYSQLYNIIEQSTQIVRELLSGHDEHIFVSEANEQGLFCEDVARSIIKNTISHLGDFLNIDDNIEIEVEIDESIHHHNLKCVINNTYGELK